MRPDKFQVVKGHGGTTGGASVIEEQSVAHAVPSLGRALRVAAVCVTLWWLPVLVAGMVLGSDHVLFQQGVFFRYLFDISGWNGVDAIACSGFFPLPSGGSQNISHVARFGTSAPRVPDGGATVVLLVGALLGLAAFARRFRI